MDSHTYIILLNYNGLKDTCECIMSLQELVVKEGYTVVVVDNSSDREEFEQLKGFALKQHLDFVDFEEGQSIVYGNEPLVLIKASKNKGFAHGNNLGLKFGLQQKGTYFWILNNDTTVHPYSLNELIKCHRKNPKMLLGSKLLYFHDKDTIQAVGGVFRKNLYICEHVGEGFSKNTAKSDLEPIDYPVGASMFVSSAFLDEVGFLDETFFLYYEELDWVYRAAKKGFWADWCETSIVYHKEGASIGSSYRKEKSFFSEIQLFKSRKKFIEKYYSLNFKFYFSSLLLIANRFRKGKYKLAGELLKMTFHDIK